MGYKNRDLTANIERPLIDINIELYNHFIDNLVPVIYPDDPAFEVTNSLFYKFMLKK